ncbi:MAG: electron transport complex subunit RsxA, partial [Mailhella sp.]|nr:electron transport complex subunit RsxA [Mailhella sp.]
VTLMVQREGLGLFDALVYAFATSAGFLLALLLMAGVRERLEICRVPRAMRGTPIALIMAGIMSLSFMAFKGMV